MKYSKQRELVEMSVKQKNTHPTADDIYNRLKPLHPNLSLGTVYRNLNTLADNGIINKISIPNEKVRFDGLLHEHSHVVCDKCHTIFDIDISLTKEQEDTILKKTNVITTAQQIIIHGRCQNCQKQ